MSLFEKPDFDASDPSILYSFGYDLSFNSAILSVEMGSSGICYRVTGVSNPGDLSFYQPNILESNTMPSFEYLSDLAKEVEEGLWPSALYATIAESGTIEALLEKSSDAQNTNDRYDRDTHDDYQFAAFICVKEAALVAVGFFLFIF